MIKNKRKSRINMSNLNDLFKFHNTSFKQLNNYTPSNIDCNENSIINIIKSNTKSIYSLSTSLKKEIDAIYKYHEDLNLYNNDIKDSIISTKDKINTLKRTTFNLSLSHKNIEFDLNELNNSTNLLKDLLLELEDLSVMTTNLSQKASLEKAYNPPSLEVIDIISEKFHNYSKEIRNAIFKMSLIFESLNNRYYSCKDEFKQSTKILDSYNTSLQQLTYSIDKINSKLNQVAITNTSLGNTTARSCINTKHLIANASELRTNISHLGKFTYSISKLSK